MIICVGCEVLAEFAGNVAHKDAANGKGDAGGTKIVGIVRVFEKGEEVCIGEVWGDESTCCGLGFSGHFKNNNNQKAKKIA